MGAKCPKKRIQNTNMADWEDELEYQKGRVANDAWEDEDEDSDDDLMDNWDDEPEPEPEPAPKEPEKKANKYQHMDDKFKHQAYKGEEGDADETAAERKRRLEETVRKSDYELAEELFTGADGDVVALEDRTTVDDFVPSTEKEFEKFADLLGNKLRQLENSEHFLEMTKKVVRSCCQGFSFDDVKELMSLLTIIQNEKRSQDNSKNKKKSKGKVKVNVRVERGNDDFDDGPGRGVYNAVDDLDDFM